LLKVAPPLIVAPLPPVIDNDCPVIEVEAEKAVAETVPVLSITAQFTPVAGFKKYVDVLVILTFA
jgi:hypothetical protein